MMPWRLRQRKLFRNLRLTLLTQYKCSWITGFYGNPLQLSFIQLFPVHGKHCAGFVLSYQDWVVILIIVKFWTKNHMCVLGKGPKKGSSATAEKCPERGHMWRMIYGCCECNQVAILPQCFPRSAVANFIIFAHVFFGFCFCRFHLKVTIAPPLWVMGAARRRQ